MFVQWYIRRPRARPPITCCSCATCQTHKQPVQAYADPGFHYREGTKLHYESVVPPPKAANKGTIIFLHGLLRSVKYLFGHTHIFFFVNACNNSELLKQHSAGRSWVPLAEGMVEDGYCCYMPDLLGFGRSPWPSIEYTVSSHCQFLLEIIKEIQKQHHSQPIHIIGHSMGALLAYELEASLRNESLRNGGIAVVKSVTLFATPYYREEGEAAKAVKCTPKGLFVRFLINCPGMSCLLCSVVCQQRWYAQHSHHMSFDYIETFCC